MEYKVGNVVQLKKTHSCGSNMWEIVRIGMDIKLRCNKCYKIVLISRVQFRDDLLNKNGDEKIEFERKSTHDKLSDGKNWIRNISEPSLEDMKQSVSEQGMTIRFIKNPPDEVIKMAIMQNPLCIKFVDNISSENAKLAISQNVTAIQFIRNPSDEIMEYARKINPQKMRRYKKNADGYYKKTSYLLNAIENIDILSEDEVLKLINQDPNILKNISKPTEKMIMKAIEKNAIAITYVANPTFEMLKLAVQKEPSKMKSYMLNADGKVVLKEKRNDNDIFKLVMDSLSEEERVLMVLINPNIIRNMDTISFEMQLALIKRDYLNLRYIRKKIHPKIYEYLYDDPKFDVYILVDDFNIQLRIVTQFEKIRKDREENGRKGEEPDPDFKDKKNLDNVKKVWLEMDSELSDQEYVTRIVSTKISINDYINFFSEQVKIKEACIATGFLYKSGLKMIEPALIELYKNSENKLTLVIGSLKDYFSASTDNKLVNIDLETAKALNEVMEKAKCNLFTLENQFFHGKYYFLEGEELSFCIVGSSNLTYSGFEGNYELNTLYLIRNETDFYNMMKGWFDEFIVDCTPIDTLSECNFADTNMKFDTINAGTSLVSVDISSIEEEIRSLSDEEVKFRLNLWMDKKPTNIYRKLDIDNLKDYVAFEFKDDGLIVFESFEAANGYYYFYSNNIYEIVQSIRELSKTQIFNMSNMEKRGYHIKDHGTLKRKIYGLFKER